LGTGDVQAFREIVASTAPALFRLAARLTGSTQEAEDVLQDSYVKAWNAIEQDRFEGRAQLETWLYRIVTNTAIDALRSQRRRGRTGASLSADTPAAGQAADTGAALRELATWLGDLPEDQHAAIVLKELEGMTSTEIATVLGCSEGAVEQKLVRARATLRGRASRG
jgi:RNA polymerase sigma-70 factor (ECF subfamily)